MTNIEQTLYPNIEILSCAQHIEAKHLANKLWARYNNLVNKASDLALTAMSLEEGIKIKHIAEKADSVMEELAKLRKGIVKCCCNY